MTVIALNTFALSTLVLGNNDSEVKTELSWLDVGTRFRESGR